MPTHVIASNVRVNHVCQVYWLGLVSTAGLVAYTMLNSTPHLWQHSFLDLCLPDAWAADAYSGDGWHICAFKPPRTEETIKFVSTCFKFNFKLICFAQSFQHESSEVGCLPIVSQLCPVSVAKHDCVYRSWLSHFCQLYATGVSHSSQPAMEEVAAFAAAAQYALVKLGLIWLMEEMVREQTTSLYQFACAWSSASACEPSHHVMHWSQDDEPCWNHQRSSTSKHDSVLPSTRSLQQTFYLPHLFTNS